MSIIQKLENSYVAILRVVVIVVATVLLLVAIVMGALSLKGILPSAQQKIDMSSVDPKDVLAEVTPSETQPEPGNGKRSAEPDRPKANPYSADYEKAYAAVASFVKTTSRNTLEIDKARFFSILDQNVAGYDADEVKAKYIAGLSTSFGTSLGDRRLIQRVEKPAGVKPRPVAAPIPVPPQEQADGESPTSEQPASEQPVPTPEPIVEEKPYKESPFVVVDEVMTAYNKIFNQKLAEAKEQQGATAAEHMEARANATARMYVAAGVFGSFLLVIFLTIAIRIERNLREIATRA